MSSSTGSAMRTLALAAIMGIGAEAAWPIKLDNPAKNGRLCDTTKEHYLQVEGYDFHDYPRFTLRWRQTSGLCGAPVAPEDLYSWEGTYDTIDGDDEPPSDGRVQLNGFVCAPFGNYELELEISSFSDANSTMQQRTAWEIENGVDQYHIWDTVNTDLADDIRYSPKVPGTYTWPRSDAVGYYKNIYAGPLPIFECDTSTPSGTVKLDECYITRLPPNEVFTQDYLELPVQGENGMSPQACSDYCAGYEYFGVAESMKCLCGTQAEFDVAKISTVCGTRYNYLCTGDSTTACGGIRAMNVFRRTDDMTPVTPSPSVSLTPQPAVPLPTSNPTIAPAVAPSLPPSPDTPAPVASEYLLEGCYIDARTSRVMGLQRKKTADDMTAEVCYQTCNDGTRTHFGTEFGNECWCGTNAVLNVNGEELDASECDIACAGDDTQKCGGRNRITAYSIGESSAAPVPAPSQAPVVSPTPSPTEAPEAAPVTSPTLPPTEAPVTAPVASPTPTTAPVTAPVISPTLLPSVAPDSGVALAAAYEGCYLDVKGSRAMSAEGKNVLGDMTNEVCIAFCLSKGHDYAGTQFAAECWCGDSFDRNGIADSDAVCNMVCEGDSSQICGGRNLLSVYSTGPLS